MRNSEVDPEEIVAQTTERLVSDAEKLKGGAKYVMNESPVVGPRLEFTPEQLSDVRTEMDRDKYGPEFLRAFENLKGRTFEEVVFYDTNEHDSGPQMFLKFSGGQILKITPGSFESLEWDLLNTGDNVSRRGTTDNPYRDPEKTLPYSEHPIPGAFPKQTSGRKS